VTSAPATGGCHTARRLLPFEGSEPLQKQQPERKLETSRHRDVASVHLGGSQCLLGHSSRPASAAQSAAVLKSIAGRADPSRMMGLEDQLLLKVGYDCRHPTPSALGSMLKVALLGEHVRVRPSTSGALPTLNAVNTSGRQARQAEWAPGLPGDGGVAVGDALCVIRLTLAPEFPT